MISFRGGNGDTSLDDGAGVKSGRLRDPGVFIVAMVEV